MAAHYLDNQFWHMLSHNYAAFATGNDLAMRGDADVLPVSATVNHSDTAYDALAKLLQVGDTTAIFTVNPPEMFPGFKIESQFEILEYVCQQHTPIPSHDVDVQKLTVADVPDMQQLIALTEPGPFFPRTVELGNWYGIRQQGELIAVAGERILTPRYREISGVCTHPDWRGRGYARLLTLTVAHTIWERGVTPYLHVAPGNSSAISLYESIDFVYRTSITAFFLTRI